MRLKSNKRGQSILEYALLLGVIIAAILIMQIFVKRGFQGGLKDSADKFGEGFSAGSTTIFENRTMNREDDQIITEQTGTSGTGGALDLLTTGINVADVVVHGAYSLSERTGGQSTSLSRQTTDAASREQFRWNEYQQTNEFDNYDVPTW